MIANRLAQIKRSSRASGMDSSGILFRRDTRFLMFDERSVVPIFTFCFNVFFYYIRYDLDRPRHLILYVYPLKNIDTFRDASHSSPCDRRIFLLSRAFSLPQDNGRA